MHLMTRCSLTLATVHNAGNVYKLAGNISVCQQLVVSGFTTLTFFTQVSC